MLNLKCHPNWFRITLNALELVILLCEFLLTPYLLGLVISFIQSSLALTYHEWGMGILFIVVQIFLVVFGVLKSQLSLAVRTKWSVLIMNSVYQKSFRISHASQKEFTSGNIINLINRDASSLARSVESTFELWSIPLSVVLGLVYLFQLIGVAVWAGLALVVFSILLTVGSGSLLGSLIDACYSAHDERVTHIREAVTGH